MWRTRAVRSLLIEDIAGLRSAADPDVDPSPELDRARRRGQAIVALEWSALALLFVLREAGREFLPLGPSIDAVFTLGVLAVAIHSGFRLGQLEKYRAEIGRAHV